MAEAVQKTKFKQFTEEINWFKVIIYGTLAIALILLINKLFGQDGWIATGFGYLKDGAVYTWDALGDGWESYKKDWETQYQLMEKGAEASYDYIQESIEQGATVISDWWKNWKMW